MRLRSPIAGSRWAASREPFPRLLRRTVVGLIAGLATVTSGGAGLEPRQEPPTVRMALGVAGDKYLADFLEDPSPGPGRRIELYLATETDVRVVAVAFDRQHRTLVAEAPLLVRTLPAGGEDVWPPAWRWEELETPIELFVVADPDGDERVTEIVRLASSIDPHGSPGLVRAQSIELRKRLDELARTSTTGSPRADLAPIAGAIRGWAWEAFARSVATDQGPQVLVFESPEPD